MYYTKLKSLKLKLHPTSADKIHQLVLAVTEAVSRMPKPVTAGMMCHQLIVCSGHSFLQAKLRIGWEIFIMLLQFSEELYVKV